MMTDKLVVLTEVERRLAQVKTVDEAKELRDQAEAFRRYARQSKRGLAAQNRCARIKLLAERRAGQLLLAVKRERGKGGGRGRRKTSLGEQTMFQRALREAGVSSATAYDWQLLAQFPLAQLEDFFKREIGAGREIVSRDVYAELRDAARFRREIEQVVTDDDRRRALRVVHLDGQTLERLRRVREIEGVRSYEAAVLRTIDAWEERRAARAPQAGALRR